LRVIFPPRAKKKIPEALGPKDCTLFLDPRQNGNRLVPFFHTHQAGILAPDPSTLRTFPDLPSGMKRISSPFTAAGPLPNSTGFPLKLSAPDRNLNFLSFQKISSLNRAMSSDLPDSYSASFM
jgi:hypothetical protein